MKVRPLTWILTAILVGVSGVAGLLAIRQSESANHNGLHGGVEEAEPALTELILRTPERDRLPLLLRHVEGSSSGLRYAAVEALGRDRTPAAADAIERAFRDNASNVRQRALELLHTIDSDRGFLLLLAGLRDEDAWIREAAALQILAATKRLPPTEMKNATPSLILALDDTVPAVASTAMSILRKLSGKTWRYHAGAASSEQLAVKNRWRQWWRQTAPEWQISAQFARIPAISPQRRDLAPDFAVNDLDGIPISRSSQNGRYTLLNFWGTWCSPCVQEVPDLQKLAETYGKRGLDVIGLALAEPTGAEGVRRWCAARNVTYQQAMATERMTEDFGHIHAVPVSVLIDSRGRIRYRWEGERDFGSFQATFERVLKEDGDRSVKR